MGRVLLHICGPITIYSYGAAIAIGALLFIWLVARDERFKKLNLDSLFSDIFLVGLVSAVIGGRILHLIGSTESFEHWWQLIAFWQPGFSILGSVIGILCVVPAYLRYHAIPIVPFFDLIATYSGLLQGISRIGCFFAGCCFGCQTSLPWSICYTDPDSMAPLYAHLHPTQLYSAAGLLLIFVFMYYIGRTLRIPGQQFTLYIMLIGIERFLIDFLRGDREYIPSGTIMNMSLHQMIALGLVVCAGISFVWITIRKRPATIA